MLCKSVVTAVSDTHKASCSVVRAILNLRYVMRICTTVCFVQRLTTAMPKLYSTDCVGMSYGCMCS